LIPIEIVKITVSLDNQIRWDETTLNIQELALQNKGIRGRVAIKM